MRCRCRRTLVYLRGRDCGAHAVNTLQTTDCVCTMDAARTLRATPSRPRTACVPWMRAGHCGIHPPDHGLRVYHGCGPDTAGYTLQTTDCVCTMDAARTLRDTPCASLRVAAQQALVLVSHLQLGEGYRGMHGARVLFSNHPGSGRFHRTPANPTPRPVHHMNLKPKTATNRS